MSKLQYTAEWLRNLPNKLTLARIAVVLPLLLLYPLGFSSMRIICAVLFALAATTDFIDGWLARRVENVTPLGALLDPIADKILTASALVLLANAGFAPAFIVALLICRDIAVSGIRLVALERSVTIKVNEYGKWKSAVMYVAIFCLMVNEPLFDLPMRPLGMVLLWASLGLSLYSAWLYSRDFLQKSKIIFHS